MIEVEVRIVEVETMLAMPEVMVVPAVLVDLVLDVEVEAVPAVPAVVDSALAVKDEAVPAIVEVVNEAE